MCFAKTRANLGICILTLDLRYKFALKQYECMYRKTTEQSDVLNIWPQKPADNSVNIGAVRFLKPYTSYRGIMFEPFAAVSIGGPVQEHAFKRMNFRPLSKHRYYSSVRTYSQLILNRDSPIVHVKFCACLAQDQRSMNTSCACCGNSFI